MKRSLTSLSFSPNSARRRGFLAAVVLAAGVALPQLPAMAQSSAWHTEQWVGTWGTAPACRRWPRKPRPSATRPCA
jgi:hypothetical protein